VGVPTRAQIRRPPGAYTTDRLDEPSLSILHPYFGIRGDGTDERVGLQAWLDACIANGLVGTVPPPPAGGAYGWKGTLYPCGRTVAQGGTDLNVPTGRGARIVGTGNGAAIFRALDNTATWQFGDGITGRDHGYLADFEVDAGDVADTLWRVTWGSWNFMQVHRVFLHNVGGTPGIAITTDDSAVQTALGNPAGTANNSNNGVLLNQLRINRARQGALILRQSEFWKWVACWIDRCAQFNVQIKCSDNGGNLNSYQLFEQCAFQSVDDTVGGPYNGQACKAIVLNGCRLAEFRDCWWELVGDGTDTATNVSRAVYLDNKVNDGADHSVPNQLRIHGGRITPSPSNLDSAGQPAFARYAIETSNDANSCDITLEGIDWAGLDAYPAGGRNASVNSYPILIPNTSNKTVAWGTGRSNPLGNYGGSNRGQFGGTVDYSGVASFLAKNGAVTGTLDLSGATVTTPNPLTIGSSSTGIVQSASGRDLRMQSQGGTSAISFAQSGTVRGSFDGSGNFIVGATTPGTGGFGGALLVKNAATLGGTNPTTGAIVYADAGALKARTPSGTVTTLAVAEPHCPTCGRDSAVEWANPAAGWELSICVWCLSDALGGAGVIKKVQA
jgi:hypothetical protein